jgi:hypothetical protein
MKVRIRKAGPGEKPRFVSKLNNLVDKAKGGRTAAVENFIESEIENGSDPVDVISKLESFNIKGDTVESLVYDTYDRYQDTQNYYNAKQEKAPYEEETPQETEEELDNAELYEHNSNNIGLPVVNEGVDENQEYAIGGEFMNNSIFPKQTKPYFIGLDAAPFDSEFAYGGNVPSKSKFLKSYMKQLKKAAEGDQVNNNEFFLPPTGTINDPMGNSTKQNQMFAGAVKQIGNEAMMQKQAEEAYQNMFTKAAGGSQEPHDWIDELHGYGESLQHAMPNMNQNTLNSFIMKGDYARGGRVRRANKALFGTPFAIPGVDVNYEFGPLGGMRKASADWDVQALGNLVNFLPGGMNMMPGMMPGMMSSGWKSVSYPAQVRKKIIQTVNNKALDEVAKTTPGSDATQKQKTDKKKQLTCPPGSFYDAAKDMCVDMNGIPMPSKTNLPTVEELMINPWSRDSQFEEGGFIDQSIIDPSNPMLMKFIYGGDDQYAMGGNVLPKALNGFETWARDRVNLDGTLKNKPSLSYEATNPWARKSPLDLQAPTISGNYGNVPTTGVTAPNPTPNQGPAGPVQPPNQNQTINPQQFSPQQMQQYMQQMQQMQQMSMGRPQRLGFGLTRDFNYTQGFSPNWNIGEDTKHLRQETYKDRGKWYNPFDTKKVTDWYRDPVTGESKPKSEAAAPSQANAAGPENAPGYNPNAAGPGYSGYNADSDGNNIPDYLQADGDMNSQQTMGPSNNDYSGRSNTDGLNAESTRKIKSGERQVERQTARGMNQFPEDFQEGTPNAFAKQPVVDFSAPKAPVSPDVTLGNQGNPVVGATNVTYNNPIKDDTNIMAGAGSGTGPSANPAAGYSGSGMGAMERADQIDNPQPQNLSYNAPARPAYNTMYPAGTSSSTGIDSVYEPETPVANSTTSAPSQNQRPAPTLNNPGLANPYAKPNPLALPTPSLSGRDGGFIPSYMAYGGYAQMAKNGITVDQPEFSDPNFVGRTIEQSAYTFDPKQMGTDLFRGPASIFGMATSIGNAINNEKNILDPARKQYRTSDAATANTGQSGFGSAEVTGSQMGDKGWYNQWGKNIENVGFEGNEVNTKMGGTGNKQYQKGRVYTLTLEQIKAIEAAGGKVEYLK